MHTEMFLWGSKKIKKNVLLVLLDVPLQGTTDEYPQHMFHGEIRNIISELQWTLITTTTFVSKDVAIKMNLQL